ncbi:prenyltransferase-like [Longilinea arvoryzae]|uniref:Prenyltransferase-like n=1 Tax=Longilinea arvoryzae TaxID=360412 RepID=A0A0S7BM52_9CHLR|nr:prenyltransferase/squalene oxidase repeat-containing protein [Longilinea arvoryzae]GAP15067.1 prenyltransferase-like [Longilinea arvoryzae]
MNDFTALLESADHGHMTSTVYDTAWIARLGELDYDISNCALEWINEHQLEDGSWGTSELYNYYDRVVCTLSAMIALTYRGRRALDRKQIDKGLIALENISNQAENQMTSDPNGATVGFELIVPTLISEAENLKIISHQGDRILGRLQKKRARKLSAMGGAKVNRYISAAFSAEMAGTDMQEVLDLANLKEANGSVGHSPSATAYLAKYVQADSGVLEYLRGVITPDGGAPNVAPFDVFERGWVLWNLALAGLDTPEILHLCQPQLDFLEKAWKPGRGIGWAAGYTPKDGDDSGLVCEVLARFGRPADVEALLSYEQERWFRCFEHEANPSVSANIHILGALRHAGFAADHPAVMKILQFLAETRNASGYWEDKWHVSPYYASAHAVVACAGYAPELVKPTVAWLLKTQRPDGAWGFCIPTAEETAYSMQALCVWRRHDAEAVREALKRGADWLREHQDPPYPALWIGKCLYLPELVVRSAISSALEMEKKGE